MIMSNDAHIEPHHTMRPDTHKHEIIQRFIASLDVTSGTQATYRRALQLFFQWISNEGVSEPSRETILAYKHALDAQGLRSFTRANYLTAVRRFFEWAESVKLYPNIAKGIKGTKRTTQVHHKPALTLEKVQLLLASIDTTTVHGKRDYALINLLVHTGLRLVEIQQATIDDLEEQDDDRALLWIRGKGRDDKDNFVVVTEDALAPIRTYLRKRKAKSRHVPLFASVSDRNRGKRLTTFSLSRLIKQRLRQAGITSRRITAHSLRHTFGVLAMEAGASLYEVQLAMRHSSPTTTQVYLGDIEQTKRQAGGPEKKLNHLLKHNT